MFNFNLNKDFKREDSRNRNISSIEIQKNFFCGAVGFMKHIKIIMCIYICLGLLLSTVHSETHKFVKFFGVCFGRYSDEEFKQMTKKLDLVILDSYHYPKPPAILKDTRKDFIVLAYMSALDVTNMEEYSKKKMQEDSKAFRMYKEWEKINSHENWFHHDKNGNRIRLWLHNKKVVNEEKFSLNMGNKQLQEYYGERTANLIKNGYDGIFMDNVWVNYPFTWDLLISFCSAEPANMDKKKWWGDCIDFLKAIKKAVGGKIIVFNQVRGNDTENSLKYLAVCDGAMDESWLGWKINYNSIKEGINIIKLINEKNKISLPIAIGQAENRALFLYCSYLLVKDGDNAYFSYMKGYNFKGMNWYPFYEIDIGSAKGQFYEKEGLLLRKFSKGLVIVNPNSSPKSIVLEGEYKNRKDVAIKKVSLKPGEGTILLQDSY